MNQQKKISFNSSSTLTALFDPALKAPHLCCSHDKEIGLDVKNAKDPRHHDKRIPHVFAGIIEGQLIWSLINQPTKSKPQLELRQGVIDTFLNLDPAQQDLLVDSKNQVYTIAAAINTLFQTVSSSPNGRDRTPMIFAYRDGASQFQEQVMAALTMLEQGQASLTYYIELLKGIDDPAYQGLAKDFRALVHKSSLLTREYFLNKDRLPDIYFCADLEQTVIRTNSMLGVFLEFGRLIQKEGYARATFNESKPAGYKEGWCLTKPKKNQTLNDSPLHRLLTAFSGENGSGKSQTGLKQNYYMQCLAQSLGYVAAEAKANSGGASLNFHFYDSLFFIDRPTTDHKQDLSAFGREIVDWIATLSLVGEKPCFFVDEAFSTTSPDDQYKLIIAIAKYCAERGARFFLATHNDKAIKKLQSRTDSLVYKIHVTKQPDGTKKHRLVEGVGDSKAIDVANDQDYPAELIDIARGILAGHFPTLNRKESPPFEPVKPYSEAVRSALKTQSRSIFDILAQDPSCHRHEGDSPSDNRVFRKFSKDETLTPSPDNGFDFGTQSKKQITFGGWSFDPIEKQASFVNRLLLEVPPQTSAEVLERQNLFASILKMDPGQVDAFEANGNRAIWAFKYLYLVDWLLSQDFIGYNHHLHPFGDDFRSEGFRYSFTNGHPELLLTYLRFNQHALGDRFPFHRERVTLEQIEAQMQNVKTHFESVDLPSTVSTAKKRLDEVITDQAVLSAFNKLATDEPNKNQWPKNITWRRVRVYLDWLREEQYRRTLDEQVSKTIHYLNQQLAIQGGNFSEGRINPLINQATEHVHRGIEDNLLPSGSPVCIASLRRLQAGLAAEEQTIFNQESIDQIELLIHQLWAGLAELPVPGKLISPLAVASAEAGPPIKWPEKPLSLNQLQQLITPHFEYFCKQSQMAERGRMPSANINNLDLEQTGPLIEKLAHSIIDQHQNGDYEYQHNYPPNLMSVMALSILADPQDPIGTLIADLRSVDSVIFHQAANHFEEQLSKMNKYLEKDQAWPSDNPQSLPPLVQLAENPGCLKDVWTNYRARLKPFLEPSTLAQIDQDVTRNQADSLQAAFQQLRISSPRDILKATLPYPQYPALSEEVAAIEADYARLFNTYPFINSTYCLKYATNILDALEGEPDQDKLEEAHIGIRDLNYDFPTPTGWDEFSQETEGEELSLRQRQRRLKDFIEHSGIHDELMAIRQQFNDIKKRGMNLCRQYKIEITSKYDRSPRDLFAEGSIWAWREKISAHLHKNCYGHLIISPDDNQSLLPEVAALQGLMKMGREMHRRKWNAFSFNDQGIIDLKGVTYLPKYPDQVTPNDVHLDMANHCHLNASPNMSGKTQFKKSIIRALLAGLATGHGPFDSGTMPILQILVYLDRVMAKTERGMSAYTTELDDWKQLWKLVKENVHILAAIDEAFSSTSPRYQDIMFYTAIFKLLEENHFIIASGHNHDAIEELVKLPGVHPHHFAFHFDEKGQIQFDYTIQPGLTKSNGVAVARKLGLPEEILNFIPAEK